MATTRIRHKQVKNRGFYIAHNRVTEDIDNMEALALYHYLRAKPRDWRIIGKAVQNHFNIGRDKYYKALNYLKEKGYITTEAPQDEQSGKLNGKVVILNEMPEWMEEELYPISGIPGTEEQENRSTENPNIGESGSLLNKHTSLNNHKEQNTTASQPIEKSANASTWEAYRGAYSMRYAVDPVRNAAVNSQIANLVKRLGAEEAPFVAAFYVTINSGFYVRAAHPVNLLLRDAEKIRMEWATNRVITDGQARSLDRRQSTLQAIHEAQTILERDDGGQL